MHRKNGKWWWAVGILSLENEALSVNEIDKLLGYNNNDQTSKLNCCMASSQCTKDV